MDIISNKVKSSSNLAYLAFTLLIVLVLYWDTFADLVARWDHQEEYSHGYLIPVLTAYFIWLRRFELLKTEFSTNWWGLVLVFIAVILYCIGTVSILYIVLDYSFILLLFGLAWALLGSEALKIVALPVFMLTFAIPLPAYLESLLSAELQLISSQLGVNFIRLCEIPVYLEGNIIDLGVYKLQVVEACSGLRYLFPLMSLGFICAYMFDAVLWKRVFVFLSCIPITIIMNSFRIGVVGVLVDNWGIEMAEGFIHDFEGWAVFMACLAILVLEIFILSKLTNDNRPFAEVFGLLIDELNDTLPNKNLQLQKPFFVSMALLSICLLFMLVVGKRTEVIPDRQLFAEFPKQFEGWSGVSQELPEDELRVLKLTDYLLVDYQNADYGAVNLYSAYYQSQKRSVVPHSPRVCIPGGGWEIADISRTNIEGLPINRMLIKKGDRRQLVYYWYQLKKETVANEFLMKWYLFMNSLLYARSDGALVRLVTGIPIGDKVDSADQRLQTFYKITKPKLEGYIPG